MLRVLAEFPNVAANVRKDLQHAQDKRLRKQRAASRKENQSPQRILAATKRASVSSKQDISPQVSRPTSPITPRSEATSNANINTAPASSNQRLGQIEQHLEDLDSKLSGVYDMLFRVDLRVAALSHHQHATNCI